MKPADFTLVSDLNILMEGCVKDILNGVLHLQIG